jgi:hypothetical protein
MSDADKIAETLERGEKPPCCHECGAEFSHRDGGFGIEAPVWKCGARLILGELDRTETCYRSQIAALAAENERLKKDNERLNMQYAGFLVWYSRYMETCTKAKSAFKEALKDVCTSMAERGKEKDNER